MHGFVKLTDAEVQIINTPVFQRLRETRQLAVAHYVYPGACHSRFEHSIGCLHLSDVVLTLLLNNEQKGDRPRLSDAYRVNAEDAERARGILRLAALLHDVGHPPFSHSGEKVLPTWADARTQLSGSAGGRDDEHVTHEDMTAHLIRTSELAEVIERNYRSRGITVEDVISVAVKPGAVLSDRQADPLLWLLHDILTSDFGTDRMDYLLRDAHHSGQPTGIFDFRKLLDSLLLIDDARGAKEDRGGVRLGIDGDGWLVAEQMVVARYLMYIALYFHKTKRVLEKHMERFLPVWTEKRFGTPYLPIDLNIYKTLTESAVLADVAQAATDQGHPGHRDARPFVDRSHFRLAKELVLSDNAREVVVQLPGGEGQSPRVVDRYPDKKRLDRFREFVHHSFGRDVIVDTADHSATKMFSPGSEVLVLLDGQARYLGELSEIVRGMPTRVWRCRVYGPEKRKAEIKAACDEWLKANPSERISFNARRDDQ